MDDNFILLKLPWPFSNCTKSLFLTDRQALRNFFLFRYWRPPHCDIIKHVMNNSMFQIVIIKIVRWVINLSYEVLQQTTDSYFYWYNDWSQGWCQLRNVMFVDFDWRIVHFYPVVCYHTITGQPSNEDS